MNLKNKNILPLVIFILLSFAFARVSEPNPVIYLIGDSTMANKPPESEPEKGWGQLFFLYFKDSIVIENHAQNGRSTKSFLREERWQKVYEKLKPGDYVFIQFGHNDSKISDTNRYAEANTLYRENLIKFISEAKEKGAVPILLTPVNRRKFDKEGNFIDQHGEYPKVVREIAKESSVCLIDLHQKSMDLFRKLGPEETKKIFLMKDKKGKEDNTHFNEYGAKVIAGLVSEGLKELNIPICKLLK